MASYRQLKSSKRWNVQVRLAGQKPQSATFDTKSEAEAWARNLETKKTPVPAKLRFLDIGLLYCERVLYDRPSYPETLRRVHCMSKCLPTDLSNVTRDVVNAYRLERLRQVRPVTVRDELQLISRIYRCAYRELILDEQENPNPCVGVPMPPTSKPRNRVIRKDELELLLSALPKTMQTIVELAYETAMRRSEIVNLKAKHIHLEERILSVVDGKTGDRSVPLSKRAVRLLGESLSACDGPEARLYPVTPHSVSTAVRRARRAVGLDDDVRLHQLRHTRITEVAKKGFNQAQIMMVSGHRDVRSVQRYTHLNVRDVIDLLD